MLDIGTGSGILAVYGVMLGADRVVAIDIDPEALRWAERNIALNNLEESIELSSVPLCEIKEEFSLVAANLILSEIERLFHCLQSQPTDVHFLGLAQRPIPCYQQFDSPICTAWFPQFLNSI